VLVLVVFEEEEVEQHHRIVVAVVKASQEQCLTIKGAAKESMMEVEVEVVEWEVEWRPVLAVTMMREGMVWWSSQMRVGSGLTSMAGPLLTTPITFLRPLRTITTAALKPQPRQQHQQPSQQHRQRHR
jgi:hypothetical protein